MYKNLIFFNIFYQLTYIKTLIRLKFEKFNLFSILFILID